MSKFHSIALALLVGAAALPAQADGDAARGETVFRKCAACHAVGDGAKHKVGPELNGVLGRTAGTADGFRYSGDMVTAGDGGLVWSAEAMDRFLEKPKAVVAKTRMAFAGLRKAEDRADVIAYLAQFSEGGAAAAAEEAPAQQTAVATESAAPAAASADYEPSRGPLGIGRVALAEEIAAWDIDVRPDGAGLPQGRGTVADGEPLYTDNCASCHGDFGEGTGRWPVLAGGHDTLTDQRPEKTIGSYWPYLSTVYDYVRRAMPFGNARSLSDDDVYAITAYLLYLNDIVTEESFELSHENFTDQRLPNEARFIDDTRPAEPHWKANAEPCMTDCKPEPAKVTMRARVLDVTPDGEGDGID